MVTYDADETPVFLTEQQSPWSGLLSDVLAQNGIPFSTTPALGAGMTLYVGAMLERIRFFVPGSFLPQARDLVDELFSGDPTAER